jgi:hypothetical protein
MIGIVCVCVSSERALNDRQCVCVCVSSERALSDRHCVCVCVCVSSE